MISRRGLITGLVSFAVTAPAIVKVSSLMSVKVMEPERLFIQEIYLGRTVFVQVRECTVFWCGQQSGHLSL